MAHLQTYADQMGGFDFTLTQRYHSSHSATNSCRTKKPSTPFPTKKQAPPSSESNSMGESSSPLIQEPPEAPSWSKRTARRSTTSLPTSTPVEQEQLPIPNSSTSFRVLTSNCNGSIQAGRPESVDTSPPLPVCCISTRAIWVPTSSSEATIFWGPTSLCLVLKASTLNFIQLFLPPLRDNGFWFPARADNLLERL